MTWVPKAAIRWATTWPIRPSPTTPTVLPKISVPENDERFQVCSRSEASAAAIWRDADSSNASACAAALWILDVGALTTSTPRSVAASTSTLSSPTPARATIFSFGAAASTSASTVVAARTNSASASGTAGSSFSRSGPSTQRTSTWSPRAATVDWASLSAIRTTGRVTRPAYRLGSTGRRHRRRQRTRRALCCRDPRQRGAQSAGHEAGYDGATHRCKGGHKGSVFAQPGFYADRRDQTRDHLLLGHGS